MQHDVTYVGAGGAACQTGGNCAPWTCLILPGTAVEEFDFPPDAFPLEKKFAAAAVEKPDFSTRLDKR